MKLSKNLKTHFTESPRRSDFYNRLTDQNCNDKTEPWARRRHSHFFTDQTVMKNQPLLQILRMGIFKNYGQIGAIALLCKGLFKQTVLIL